MRRLCAYASVMCTALVLALVASESVSSQELSTPPAPSVVRISRPQLTGSNEAPEGAAYAETAEVPRKNSDEEAKNANLQSINIHNQTEISDVPDSSLERSNNCDNNAEKTCPSPKPKEIVVFPREKKTAEKSKAVAAANERSLTVTAYAYCLNGRTASGKYTGMGCIAVDPSVIPLGSKIYVPGYGWGEAMDTGGGIYGNKIDIWLPTSAACYQWGVRKVTIKVKQ